MGKWNELTILKRSTSYQKTYKEMAVKEMQIKTT
jgi:hypothetical protein